MNFLFPVFGASLFQWFLVMDTVRERGLRPETAQQSLRENGMRIAATDYDGTLCMKGVVAPEVLAAIREWRARGNVFGIVTGRDLSMVFHEVSRWNIPFDFLLCCSGAVAYDGDLAVLGSRSIEDSFVSRVLRHEASIESMHYELCCNGKVNLFVRDAASWFPRLGVPYTPISLEESWEQKNLQQISLAYHDAATGEANARALDAAFGHALTVNLNGGCVDITSGGVDKATGLSDLGALLHWPAEGILAIGDGENDIPMIRRFAGFTVPCAADSVKAEARAVYADVGHMLRDAMA